MPEFAALAVAIAKLMVESDDPLARAVGSELLLVTEESGGGDPPSGQPFIRALRFALVWAVDQLGGEVN